ncbi:S41 family peptidase [Paenibacillus sp. KN14-4R]|uniref:S41 family peptidase n=1 Tax=Paenibacillus sp. KN14-4R TaxID=3445773 RepID=UPI003FA0779D
MRRVTRFWIVICITAVAGLGGLLLMSSERTASIRSEDSIQQWKEDLDFLANELPQKHINLFHQVNKEQFMDKVNKLKEHLPHMTDQQRKVGIMELIASVGEAHTNVAAIDSKLPMYLFQFSDGIYCLMANSEYSSIVGRRITQVNGIEIETVRNAYRKIIPHENEYWINTMFPQYLTDTDLLVGLGLSKLTNEVEITYIDQNAQQHKIKVSIPTENNVKKDVIQIASPPLYWMYQNEYYYYQYIPEQKTMYFQYNRCMEDENKNFNDFAREMLKEMKEKGAEKLVVDLRLNGGGNSAHIAPLMDNFYNTFDQNQIHTYVLLSNRTFSSALFNAIDLKDKLYATWIGEPTGGKPNSYGDILSLQLPHSKLKVYYSTKYFKLAYDDNQVSFFPDVPMNWMMKDLMEGRDPLMEYVFEQKYD